MHTAKHCSDQPPSAHWRVNSTRKLQQCQRLVLAVLLGTGFGLCAQNTYTGTGIKLALPNGSQTQPLIEFVVANSPAEKAGLAVGEPVLEVDGHATTGADFWAVVRALEGEPGTRHRVVVGQDKRAISLEVSAVRGQCLVGDCTDGEGVFRDVNGDLYTGHFKGGRYHGAGRLEQGTEALYDGEFEDGVYHGKGTLKDRDKVFSGNWDHGREASGPGFMTFANGDRVEGNGEWTNGFTGTGIFTDAGRNLRVEGVFSHAFNLESLEGKASVRSLATDHVYTGRFDHGQPVKRGEIETSQGARLPAEFSNFTKLLAALNQPTLKLENVDPNARRTLTIEAVAEEPSVGTTRPAGQPRKEKTPRMAACGSCGGTGFVVKDCIWCGGKGVITHAYSSYKKKETSYGARSVYDNTGRLIGQQSGYDVTYEPIKKSWDENCRECKSSGSQTTNTRCRACGGSGTVPAK